MYSRRDTVSNAEVSTRPNTYPQINSQRFQQTSKEYTLVSVLTHTIYEEEF